jgi:hypothetical protein
VAAGFGAGEPSADPYPPLLSLDPAAVSRARPHAPPSSPARVRSQASGEGGEVRVKYHGGGRGGRRGRAWWSLSRRRRVVLLDLSTSRPPREKVVWSKRSSRGSPPASANRAPPPRIKPVAANRARRRPNQQPGRRRPGRAKRRGSQRAAVELVLHLRLIRLLAGLEDLRLRAGVEDVGEGEGRGRRGAVGTVPMKKGERSLQFPRGCACRRVRLQKADRDAATAGR